MRSLLLGCFLLPVLASAQPQLSIFTGANFPSIELGSGVHDPALALADYWYPGINFGASVQVPLTDWFQVSPLVEYNHYPFQSFSVISMGGPPFFQSASGHPSQVYRLVVEGRFVRHASNGNALYVATGIGYVIRSFGRIDETFASPYQVIPWEIPADNNWVHSIGLGAAIRLSSLLSLDLAGKSYTDYTGSFDFSINVGVSFDLAQ